MSLFQYYQILLKEKIKKRLSKKNIFEESSKKLKKRVLMEQCFLNYDYGPFQEEGYSPNLS